MVHAGGEVAGAPLLTCSPSPCSRDGTPPSLAVCVRPSHDRSSAQLDGWPTAQRRWGCRSGGGRLGNPHRKHAAAADPCQALSAACANHCVNPDLCMQLTAVSPTLAKTMRLSACWCQQHCRPRSAAGGKHRPAAAAAADVIGRPRCWFDAVEEACGRSILPSALRNARYKALRPRCAPRT